MMKLFYADLSPYARKARVTIMERNLADQVELVTRNPYEVPADLTAVNPLSKLPALAVDDGLMLYDSPVICEYLDQIGNADRLLPPSGAARWTVLRRQALADGILDAAFAVVCETLRRPENERSPDWIKRWIATIGRALDALEGEIDQFGDSPTLGHIAVGCALGYLDLRLGDHMEWRGHHPKCAAWYEVFSARPSMQATVPNLG